MYVNLFTCFYRLSVKLLRLLQNYPPPDDPGVRGRLNECLETILNKAQEPPKSKKVIGMRCCGIRALYLRNYQRFLENIALLSVFRYNIPTQKMQFYSRQYR